MQLDVLMLKTQEEREIKMLFMSLKSLYESGLVPTIGDYTVTYTTEVEEPEEGSSGIHVVLEKLYEDLNRPDRPNRKTMRSMSVGDLVLVNGMSLYFCNPVGFLEVKQSITGEIIPAEKLLFLKKIPEREARLKYNISYEGVYQIMVVEETVSAIGLVCTDRNRLEWVNLIRSHVHQGYIWDVIEELFGKVKGSSFLLDSTEEQAPLWMHLGAETAGPLDETRKVLRLALRREKFNLKKGQKKK